MNLSKGEKDKKCQYRREYHQIFSEDGKQRITT